MELFTLDFTVSEEHLYKTIELNFKCNDGLAEIRKKVVLQFVAAEVEEREELKWSDFYFG